MREEVALGEPAEVGPGDGVAGDEDAPLLVDEHVVVVAVAGDVDGLEPADVVAVGVGEDEPLGFEAGLGYPLEQRVGPVGAPGVEQRRYVVFDQVR